jgi:hypothetical protein
MRALALLLLLLLPTRGLAEIVGGVEGGSDRGYAYLTWMTPLPLAQADDLLFWLTGSYLYYRSVESFGETSVKAPGVGAGVLYRWRAAPTLSLALGPGYEYRWVTRELPGGAEVEDNGGGLAFQGAASWQARPKTRLEANGGYFGASEWLWSRASLRQEVSRSLRVGPEVGFQGNEDVKVRELGGIAEVPYGRNWLILRGGQATEDYGDGREETRPYFSVLISRSFP